MASQPTPESSEQPTHESVQSARLGQSETQTQSSSRVHETVRAARSVGRRMDFSWISVSMLVLLFAATAPSLAMVDAIGTEANNQGGGSIASLAWLVMGAVLIGKSIGRGYTAISDMGSTREEVRDQGRKEILPAVGTFFAGLIGVPIVAALLGRILPESWSWIGADLSFLGNLTGGGGGGGGGGDAASGDVGMILVGHMQSGLMGYAEMFAEHTVRTIESMMSNMESLVVFGDVMLALL